MLLIENARLFLMNRTDDSEGINDCSLRKIMVVSRVQILMKFFP